MNGIEREEELLYQQLADGLISQEEFNNEIRELIYSFQAAAEESAENAYRDEMYYWSF